MRVRGPGVQGTAGPIIRSVRVGTMTGLCGRAGGRVKREAQRGAVLLCSRRTRVGVGGKEVTLVACAAMCARGGISPREARVDTVKQPRHRAQRTAHLV